MNDWSARDIQAWEYIPLGPFTAKNVATSISPWIVTMDALVRNAFLILQYGLGSWRNATSHMFSVEYQAPFRCPTSAGKQVDPQPLPYLQDPNYGSYDINLSVGIKPEGAETDHVISRTNFRYLYWTIEQQLVHHTVTGTFERSVQYLSDRLSCVRVLVCATAVRTINMNLQSHLSL